MSAPDFFRIQFTLPDAVLLHNLSYLRDQNITAPEVYVITRARDQAKLHATWGLLTVSRPEHYDRMRSLGRQGRFTPPCLN